MNSYYFDSIYTHIRFVFRRLRIIHPNPEPRVGLPTPATGKCPLAGQTTAHRVVRASRKLNSNQAGDGHTPSHNRLLSIEIELPSLILVLLVTSTTTLGAIGHPHPRLIQLIQLIQLIHTECPCLLRTGDRVIFWVIDHNYLGRAQILQTTGVLPKKQTTGALPLARRK